MVSGHYRFVIAIMSICITATAEAAHYHYTEKIINHTSKNGAHNSPLSFVLLNPFL